jgi:tRNA pseudouridine55 synthase
MRERDGVLVVDKSAGPTSHDVVAAVRRLFGLRRVGHCGTLDPLATGVLVVCLGAYTRLSDWLGKGDKEYETTLVLGGRSDTGDRQGAIEELTGALPSREEVAAALRRFRGQIRQVPPVYSAVKVGGVPSYKLARRRQAVALVPREVEVSSLELLFYQPPLLGLHVRCSRGTYIRSLAVDLGEVLGCGAYVDQLRRLRVGRLGLADAHTLDQLRELASLDRLDQALVPVQRALGDLPACELSPEAAQVFAHGGRVRGMGAPAAEGDCAVYGGGGRLLGIGSLAGGELRPVRVFSPAPTAEAGCAR